MDLVFERPDFDYVLRGASGTRAQVNSRTLVRSFIVTRDRLIEDWAASEVDALDATALQPLLDLAPEVVLLGTGDVQGFPSPAVMAAFLQRGIGLEPMTNAACARTFNVLAGEGRVVAAAFLLPG